ncbi:acyl-CoA dehydrogenase family protein [Desulfopila sp. IMCC35008]|uniref:acyl-CoA dehydrogenase family protein n=1 Tax=Desulfopila sp. IMCC35008 TaxID=2653858 RepID=UPI0013D615B3|nr:acyl-CoA dehydrogenase family protein [Desulfopila sp. IMCC35008]
MDFELTEEQRLIQEMTRDFAAAELEPVAAELDKGGNDTLFHENIRKLAELGLMGLNIKDEYGGSEAGVIAFSVAMTEISRACASTAVTVSVNNMVNEVIQALGTEEQKKKYISKICSGEYLAGAFGLTEPGAGSDPASMTTTAVRDGDDWVLNGSKLFITSGNCAGVFVVWAVTDPKAPRGKGISLFLVEAEAKGLVVGKKEEKMGQNASATNEIIFQNCRIPGDALMGELNDGFRVAVTELAGGRIGIGSLALGLGLAAMDTATKYSLERKQFGTPISNFQAIQWKIADMYTALEASRLLLLNASFKKEQGRSFAKEASMAKVFASETANKACYEAMQILGGYGYTTEYPIERYTRDARITTIYEGTSEIQRVIISREILREFS